MQTGIQQKQTQDAQAANCPGGGDDAVSVVRRRNVLKRLLCLAGCVCWALIGAGFGWLLLHYFFHGTGRHTFGIFVSSLSVLLGVVYVSGLALGMLFSWALAIWLGACGVSGGQVIGRK
jgi:hypothetical protein